MNTEAKKRALLEKVYDSLYAEAEGILKQFNPCEHKINNGCHSCLGKLDFTAPEGHYGNNTTKEACCVGCKHWNNGCKAEKPLFCKTWTCWTVSKKHPNVVAMLNQIKEKGRGFYFFSDNCARKDRNESINFSLQMCDGFKSHKSLVELTKKNSINI